MRSSWQTYWLIDPLDGTKEFIKRNGEFTVNIALIDKYQPIIGVVHAPEKNITYYASRSQGAFKLENKQSVQSINVSTPLSRTPRVVCSRSHHDQTLTAYLQKI